MKMTHESVMDSDLSIQVPEIHFIDENQLIVVNDEFLLFGDNCDFPCVGPEMIVTYPN